jgi:hypothetical protein
MFFMAVSRIVGPEWRQSMQHRACEKGMGEEMGRRRACGETARRGDSEKGRRRGREGDEKASGRGAEPQARAVEEQATSQN